MKNVSIATTLAVNSSVLHPTRLWVFVFLSFGVSPDIPTVSLGESFCRQLRVFVISKFQSLVLTDNQYERKTPNPALSSCLQILIFTISSIMLSSTTSMVILVTPVDDKCLKIDSPSGLLLFSRII